MLEGGDAALEAVDKADEVGEHVAMALDGGDELDDDVAMDSNLLGVHVGVVEQAGGRACAAALLNVSAHAFA